MSLIKRTVEILFRAGIPSKHRVTQELAQMYVRGLVQGYEDAVFDFFHAELPSGEVDEAWYRDMPTLHRRLGGLKRWYAVHSLIQKRKKE